MNRRVVLWAGRPDDLHFGSPADLARARMLDRRAARRRVVVGLTLVVEQANAMIAEVGRQLAALNQTGGVRRLAAALEADRAATGATLAPLPVDRASAGRFAGPAPACAHPASALKPTIPGQPFRTCVDCGMVISR